MELVKDEDSTCDNSEEWTVKMNKRGLCHIKEATFNVFLAIEEELKECLHTLTGMPKRMKLFKGSLCK